MSNRLSAVLVRGIRGLAESRGGDLSDRELVERFTAGRDDGAFATLVERHGAMVLSVCRRVLSHEHDAEDVFQAVFLVLSRKAGTLRRKDAVGPWLFGVARRLSLKARQARERRDRAVPFAESLPGDPLDELTVRDARAVLDEELARLPARERGPLVLCYLEGLTRDEAAARLGCPLGTLKSRMERGRAILEKRLARRGLGLAAMLPTLVLTRDVASAVSPALQSATVESAMAFAGRLSGRAVSPEVAVLAHGMLKPTVSVKFAFGVAVVLIVACGISVELVASRSDVPPATTDRAESIADASTSSPLMPPAPPPTTTVPSATEKQVPKDEKAVEPFPTRVSGVAKAVDFEKRTLLVEHREGVDTFALADGAQVEIDGAPGDLARLPVGANVDLTDFVAPKIASGVHAGGRAFFGSPVKAVDAKKGTITIKDRGKEETFAVPPNAMIAVDGKDGAKLSAIPPGSFVNLHLAADQRTIRDIGADGPNRGGCGGSLVKSVDVQKRTITFDEKAPPDIAGKTFAIAANAAVTINGNRTGTLTDVPVGCYANVLLRVDGKTVRHVSAQGPSNLCEPGGSVVKAVDVENRTITFDEKARSEVAGKTFTLAKDAGIAIDGKPGSLSAVPPGSVVSMRLWVDRETVGQVFAVGPEVPGTGLVKAVDAAKNTLTVDDTTYPVAKDANIAVNGKAAKLSDVPAGAHVALRLNVDRKTVGSIFQVKP
jgi:RNA polymerase sigma factor (sigma-70 family)